MTRCLKILGIAILALLASVFAVAAAELPDKAQSLEAEGVPNFFRVTPDLYRSAQPSAEGMRSLEKLGIKTIINLRGFNSDKAELKGTGLDKIRVSIHTWDISHEDVVKVLSILRDPTGAPYLIHCRHGADRTGLMIAMYRIVEQGWSKEDAIEEMVEGGFGFHSIWENIIRFIRKADVKKIRRQLPPSTV